MKDTGETNLSEKHWFTEYTTHFKIVIMLNKTNVERTIYDSPCGKMILLAMDMTPCTNTPDLVLHPLVDKTARFLHTFRCHSNLAI
jgi:hypothetical protein